MELNRVGYVFGLAGNKVLLRRVAALAEATALERVEVGAYKSGASASPPTPPRQLEHRATVIVGSRGRTRGDSRFVVTNLAGTPRWLYEVVYW